MTPAEQKGLLAEIGKLIDTKIDPLAKRIDTLEVGARRRDLNTHSMVTRSLHETEEATNASLLAASNHIARCVEDLRSEVLEVRGEVVGARGEIATTSTSIVPAAQGAERAAYRTEGKTDALVVGQDELARGQQRALAWYRHPAMAAILTALVTALLQHFIPGIHIP